MPEFDDETRSDAPPEEVWKLLYDPGRFPDWWAGVGTVDTRATGDGGSYTMFPEGYPDFPMPQLLETGGDGRSVTISCLVSDLRFAWLLEPLDGGSGTAISVHVELPEAEAHRLDAQRGVVARSLRRLAELAAA